MTDRPLSKNAQAQRAFRERMKARNWLPVQVYILPEHKAVLAAVEQALRLPQVPESLIHLCQEHLAVMHKPWTTESLYAALLEHQEAATWTPTLSNAGDFSALTFTLPHCGDLPVHLAVSGEQIATSAILFPASAVTDRAAFNDLALRLGPLSTLTSIGLETLHGEDVYVAYGNLSALSPVEVVLEELRRLGDNALGFTDHFSSFINA